MGEMTYEQAAEDGEVTADEFDEMSVDEQDLAIQGALLMQQEADVGTSTNITLEEGQSVTFNNLPPAYAGLGHELGDIAALLDDQGVTIDGVPDPDMELDIECQATPDGRSASCTVER